MIDALIEKTGVWLSNEGARVGRLYISFKGVCTEKVEDSCYFVGVRTCIWCHGVGRRERAVKGKEEPGEEGLRLEEEYDQKKSRLGGEIG